MGNTTDQHLSFIERLRWHYIRARKTKGSPETPASTVEHIERPNRPSAVAPDMRFLLQQIEKLRYENAILKDKLARSELAVSRLVANYNRSFSRHDLIDPAQDSKVRIEHRALREKFSNLQIDFLAFRAATFSRHKINPRDFKRVGKFRNSAIRRKFESLFDRAWYIATYPDVESAGMDPIVHYFEFGFSEGRFPHPLFDTRWYLKTYDDVLQMGTNPFEHFVTIGVKEFRQPNAFLDLRWYMEKNADVVETGLDPFEHYARKGCFEARDPGPLFSATAHFDKHPEIQKGKVDALAHWLHATRS